MKVEPVVHDVTPSSPRCAIDDLLSLDLLRNIMEWLEYDPADPFRFSITSKRYYDLLRPIFSVPTRVTIILATEDNDQVDEEATEQPQRHQALGGPFYLGKDDGDVVRDSDDVLTETRYTFFIYSRQRQERLHLGRHVRVSPREFGLAMLRPGELEQGWEIHLALSNEDEEEEEEDTVGQEEQRRLPDHAGAVPLSSSPVVRLSVTGTNCKRSCRKDPDCISRGFLHCSTPEQEANNFGPLHTWAVKHPAEEDLARARRTATLFRLRFERRQITNPVPVPALNRSRVLLHPKSVLNFQGMVCLYDPPSLIESNLTSRTLNHAGVHVRVKLNVWIEDSHCCVHAAEILPFKIAVPICRMDEMDETCDAKKFISYLYENASYRGFYIIYYCVIAASDALNDRGIALECMRNHPVYHPVLQCQHEEINDEGHWFYLVNKHEEVEPTIPDQPSRVPFEPWCAAVGLYMLP